MAWRAFVDAWSQKHSGAAVGVADLYALADTIDGLGLGKGDEKARRTSLGIQLAKRRDSIVSGLRLMQTKPKQGASHWKLVPVNLGRRGLRRWPSAPSIPRLVRTALRGLPGRSARHHVGRLTGFRVGLNVGLGRCVD